MASENQEETLPSVSPNWGPPAHQGKTAKQIVDIINRNYAGGGHSSYGNVSRAWAILGWVEVKYHSDESISRKEKPRGARPNFDLKLDNLWEFLYKHRRDDFEGRLARARILEALRSAGYYRRTWRVTLPRLNISRSTPAAVYDDAVEWEDQEGPNINFPGPKTAANEYLKRPPRPSLKAGYTWPDVASEEGRLWTKYHPYQGFVAVDKRGQKNYFHAVPVPDEHSLWHSISYQDPTNPGCRNIMKHYEVKACIWAYFTQVLEHPKHERWRDYMWMNYMSQTEAGTAYGPRSILKHLHCNERIHGILGPVSPTIPNTPPRDILFVIADYYGVQIVVFYFDTSKGWIDLPQPTQQAATTATTQRYKADVYGASDERSQERPQILLVTSDHLHYDPVVWEGDRYRTHNKNDIPWLDTPPAWQKRMPAPWWDPPAIGPSNWQPTVVPHLRPRPSDVPHFSLPGNANVNPKDKRWDPSEETKLTHNVVDRFRAGLDIPGLKFIPPPREVMETWNSPREPRRFLERETTMDKQIRFDGHPPGPKRKDAIYDTHSSVFYHFYNEFPLYPHEQGLR